MSLSCWSTSERLRRDNVSNMSSTCICRLTCSPANINACSWSSSTACATCPISSLLCTGNGWIGPGAAPERTRSSSRTRSSCATLSAPSRSLRSGRTSERATKDTISSAIRMAAPTMAESRMASVRFFAA